jgi:hypothetical protein
MIYSVYREISETLLGTWEKCCVQKANEEYEEFLTGIRTKEMVLKATWFLIRECIIIGLRV